MLYVFDMDGTLIRSFMREGYREDYDKVDVLPGRVEALRKLQAHHYVAIATNQGGVAFGYQTEEQVMAKMERALVALRLPADTPVYACFAHPNAKIERYRDPIACESRKPKPGMIWRAMRDHGVSEKHTAFVGDMDSDREAAEAAGVAYFDAEQFFSSGESA